MNSSLWVRIVVLTMAIELLTVGLRFGFRLESTRDTASTIGLITNGLRVHHGYCGILLLVTAWGISQTHRKLASISCLAGWPLLFSDAIHHFLVLWPITGSPHFDFFY